MGCNCGRAATRREVLRTTRNAPAANGQYLLSSYPDCSTLYTGPYQADSIYVVGRNTEFEALFLHSELTAATDHALAEKLTIENIPVVAICADAINDLYVGA